MKKNNSRNFILSFLGLVCIVLLLHIRSSFLPVKLIPREVLFVLPDYIHPTLSPDGNTLAYLAKEEQKSGDHVLNVYIRDLKAKRITQEQNRSILHYSWSPDGTKILYSQDHNGDENWHIYGVDIQTGTIFDYTPFGKVHATVIASEYDYPDTVLISLNKDNKSLFDVYRLNLKTSELTRVAKNTGNISQWVADKNLHIRAAIATRDDGGTDILWRAQESDDWSKIISWSIDDTSSSGIICFSHDGNNLYLLDSSNSDTNNLVAYNCITHQKTILAHDQNYDINDVFVDSQTREIYGYSVLKSRSERHFFNNYVRDDYMHAQSLCAQHLGFLLENFKKQFDLSIIDTDKNNKTWILSASSDTAPTAYFIYNRVTKELNFLFYNKPKLNDYILSPQEPITIKTRDNIKLEGYITFPVGPICTSLPLVLFVHGGPWARDRWGYDAQVQWLANRGYICLQINYRGSTGYGKKFTSLGDGEWGKAMLNDLVDAVDWAINRGYADPQKIGIYGGSYGGYATLAGLTMTNKFALGIDLCGPANLITLIESFPAYWSTYMSSVYKRIGDPRTKEGKKLLSERSPIHFVNNIKVPIMIVQGAYDPRVTQKEYDQIISMLEQEHKPYEHLLFPDEGHGLLKESNRRIFYENAEKFLARTLHGRVSNL